MNEAPQISGDVAIDVISDVVCPWCFVGKRRLALALDGLPDVAAHVRWLPYQLDGTIPKGGIAREEYLERKFGPERNAHMYLRLEGIGREVGIDFHFEKIKRSPNTLDAHRLLRWASAVGTQNAVKERLLQLYFIEGADVGDPDVLAETGAAHGIEAGVVRRLLASDADEDAVRADIETAQRIGVRGVPFFIFNGRLAVSGAQTPEVLTAAIAQAIAEGAQA